MAEPAGAFAEDEHRRRVSALQREMAGAGLHALLLTTPPDVFYVTGFLTRFWESPARPWFVIVPEKGAPVAVIPAIGAEPMRRTWLRDIRTWPAPDPDDDGTGLLVDAVPHGALGVRDGHRICRQHVLRHLGVVARPVVRPATRGRP